MASEPAVETLDFFRQREADTWREFLEKGSVEALLAHAAALRALNAEIETRVQMMLERGRVQTSGKKKVGP